MPQLTRDLLKLPDQVRRGDFVLRLAEGIEHAERTLADPDLGRPQVLRVPAV